MFNFVAWILAGGGLGLLASRLVGDRDVAAALINVLAGMVGGFVSGLLVRSALAALDPAVAWQSGWAMVAAVSGAMLLVGVVNLPGRVPAAYRWVRRPGPPEQ